jgi:dTDP-glucose 4,6-dehydratase
MKIALIGGAGFIGTNLINHLVKSRQDCEILCIDSLELNSSKKNCSYISKFALIEVLDILNYKRLEECLFNFNPEKIVHLAAQSHVDESIVTPKKFIDTNIIGTYNILEASNFLYKSKKITEAKNFLLHYVSTDEVFGDFKANNYEAHEDSKFLTNSPYSASKAAGNCLVNAWSKTFSLPTRTSFASNNYGKFQNPEKLIPKAITSLINGKNIPIYGSGLHTREWIHVDDHSRAIETLIFSDLKHSSYNISSKNRFTNLEIIQFIIEAYNQFTDAALELEEVVLFVDDRLGHDFEYKINSERFRSETNWTEIKSIKSGLKETVSWYLDNKNWWQDLTK